MKNQLVILGGGESGVGAALLGKAKGWNVFLSDAGELSEKYRSELISEEIRFEEHGHSLAQLYAANLIVKSPGIPDTADVITSCQKRGIEIVSEIEFAFRFTKGKVIAITGSNGKTTTTTMIHAMLERADYNVAIGGNIGFSFARLVIQDSFDWYVLELSSFQLDGIKDFKPHIAVLLNITPDHLDRYGYDFNNYIASKFRIGMNQKAEDYFIYNIDDEVIVNYLQNNLLAATQIPFSIEKELEMGGSVAGEELQIKLQNNFNMGLSSLALTGKHNIYNSMAAGIVGKIIEIKDDLIRQSMMDFQALEHRLESILELKGVNYINDSKATNVNSTWYALEAMNAPVIWIAGGVDKGNDYAALLPLVREKVKAIVCIGSDNRPIHEAFSKHVDLIMNMDSMEDAVTMSSKLAVRGDIVLLSPACASFDKFKNYEERGQKFKDVVFSL